MKPTMTTVRIEIAVKMLVTVRMVPTLIDKHLNDLSPNSSDISHSISEKIMHMLMSYTIIAMFNSSRYMTLYALRVSTSVLFIGKI